MALQAEGLPHQVVAVSSYEQLKQCCEEQVRGQVDIRHIFLVNCGAAIDLKAQIFVNNMLDHHQSVYIIDHNRPVHLNNIFDWPEPEDLQPPTNQPSIYLLTNEHIDQIEHIKKINQSVWLNRTEEFRTEMLYQISNSVTLGDDATDYDDDDDDEGAGENFADLDDDELGDFIVPDGDANDYEDDDDFEGDDDEDRDNQVPPVRLRVRNRDAYSKSEYSDLMDVMKYYTITSYGFPSSTIIYQFMLATSARQIFTEYNKLAHNNALWAVIIGFTSQFMAKKLSLKQYNDQVDKYVSIVMANNNHYRSAVQTASGNVTEATSEVRIVYESEDYVFALYRHWNLYSAMINSPQLYAHYNDWKHDTERVAMFLAKIGVPLVDCKHQYVSMRHDLREAFKVGIKNYATVLTREPLYQKTFVRFYGTDFEASAFDMVYILKTLMNKPITPTQRLESIVDPTIWNSNWHIAEEALNGTVKVLQDGVRTAIAAQRKIVQQVKHIISSQSLKQDDMAVSVNISRALTLDSGFYVRETPESNSDSTSSNSNNNNNNDASNIFVLTPNGLSELATLLLSVLDKMQLYKKPLIIFAPSSISKELVYGLTNSKAGQNKNPFAYAFRKAAKTVGAQLMPVGFEQSMVEVNKNDKVNMMSGLLHEFQLSLGNTSLE